MKWTHKTENKSDFFNSRIVHIARKNNYKFKIVKAENKKYKYYVEIEDLKENNKYNSLWEGINFDDLERTKKKCLSYAKENKNDRLTDKKRKKIVEKFWGI